MRMKYGVLAAAAAMLASTGASAFEFEGYTRVGPGAKRNSGDGKYCYDGAGIGGHGGIGRLGNECNTYGEFALSQTLDAGGVKYKALFMPNFFKPGSDAGSGGGTNVQFNQLYVEGTGYDIAPSLTFWIGKRFYHRADVHFDDTFFVNMGDNGTGAGVDGINPGIGTLSVAAFRSSDNDTELPSFANASPSAPNAGTKINVDWEKIDVNPGGQLRVTAVVSDFGKASTTTPGEDGTPVTTVVRGTNGSGISLQHIQTLATDSDGKASFTNTAWLQGARGSSRIDMAFGSATARGVKSWRIVDSLAWLKGPLTGQTLIQFGRNLNDVPDAGNKYITVAGRVAYAITNNFKIQGELGSSTAKPDGGGDRQNVSKFTIAPTLTVGQDFYSRPELRLYASYFKFNDAYAAAQGVTNKSKTAVGFQAEIWF